MDLYSVRSASGSNQQSFGASSIPLNNGRQVTSHHFIYCAISTSKAQPGPAPSGLLCICRATNSTQRAVGLFVTGPFH